MNKFISTFDYKLIYVFRINDEAHKGLLKIGDATVHTDSDVTTLAANSRELNLAAKKRINEYTSTAGIGYELLHTELAIHTVEKEKTIKIEAFRDNDVHSVLTRSGIKKHFFNNDAKGKEWFNVDLETAKNAIIAVKKGLASLSPNAISVDNSPIIFRPEQEEAIKATLAQFKKSNRMLWNAKMRFGKTLSALEVAKQSGYKKTLIFTHRPVVSTGWYEDFKKIFKGTDYVYGSKSEGENIDTLADSATPFVYFASIQDLRGSAAVGGKFEKNELIFLIDWDLIVVDEAHEGTKTTLGQAVINTVLSADSAKTPKMLELSGTPFNLLGDFHDSEIYTWDYIMEQRAKNNWAQTHFGDSNPYAELPQMHIYTYNLDKTFAGYIDIEDSAFNFREFFRTWTGEIAKDYKPMPPNVAVGDFVHVEDVNSFLNLITKTDKNTNYPFATEEYRSYFRHTLWMLPGVAAAKAFSQLLQNHPIFGSNAFKIVNVAGAGDEEKDSRDALSAVQAAIGDNPDETYSITLSCGRLTTGVTVPEWTAVMMLAGSFSTAASSYLQTIFRVQTPANINGKIKEHCCVFDFAPDRTLKMVAEAGQLSSKAGQVGGDKVVMGEFLNYCPVISVEGSSMSLYDIDSLLQQLKKAYTDRVVKSGFDDIHIYNDNLLKLDDIELQDFEALKKIVGASKQSKKLEEIDINNQGYTNEEYEELARIEAKPKKERSPEEAAFLEEKKKKKDNAQKAMSILRGISIRIPLLVYGADVPPDKEITCNDFVNLIDDSSWNEFMPTGVTKEVYKKFAKYYDGDIFVAAGRQIRNIALKADELLPTERVKKIASLFSTFKNPDKETVLTPWRVVNMHMSDCLGGYDFFDDTHTEMLDEPRFVDQGGVTAETLSNLNANILEINSKTGLYPLYVTYSLFRKRIETIAKEQLTFDEQNKLWKEIVENNMFIICKTPMAKSITKRTLLGYRSGQINAHAFDDLIGQLKEKPEQFRDKVLRGSFWNKENKKMKFDAIVGNPPYQVMDGGQAASSSPIYNIFVNSAVNINPDYLSMIMPARWYAGGKGLDEFRNFMLSQRKIKKIVDFSNSIDCFPGVNIAGGICYFLWDKNYNGKCNV
ncbi:MAG: Eco57I restriction-modification methylase domain-containing protein, partial [Clostridia bacterium]